MPIQYVCVYSPPYLLFTLSSTVYLLEKKRYYRTMIKLALKVRPGVDRLQRIICSVILEARARLHHTFIAVYR